MATTTGPLYPSRSLDNSKLHYELLGGWTRAIFISGLSVGTCESALIALRPTVL